MANLVVSNSDLVRNRLPAMVKSLPGKGSAIKRFQQAAISASMSPILRDCTGESIVKCIYACARLNLIPDPILHLAAIVPFNNKGQKEAQLIIEYRGLIELAKRATPGIAINVGTVYENDDYVLEQGMEDVFKITKRWWEKGGDQGKMVFSYCVSKMPGDSNPQLVVVSNQEALALANKSKAGMKPGTPWKEHFDRMAEKTAIRRSSRLWQMDPEKEETRQFRESLEYDEASPEDLPELPDIESDHADHSDLQEGTATLRETKNIEPDMDDPATDTDIKRLNQIAKLKLTDSKIKITSSNILRLLTHCGMKPNISHGESLVVGAMINEKTTEEIISVITKTDEESV